MLNIADITQPILLFMIHVNLKFRGGWVGTRERDVTFLQTVTFPCLVTINASQRRNILGYVHVLI